MTRRFQFSFEPSDDYTLNDFRRQLADMNKVAVLDMIRFLPATGAQFVAKEILGDAHFEKNIRKLRGIIDSMTVQERHDPTHVIDANRRQRIATGAGADPMEVALLVRSFDGMAEQMKRMRGLGRH
jgi:signal recognition particle subunit SRP54